MRKVVLYRSCNNLCEDSAEIEALQKAGFVCLKSRTQIQKNDLVVPRYSSLPFFEELEADVNYLGAKLITSYQQHNYVADLQNYVVDLKELTPLTWSDLQAIPDEGPFILKGTNSRKGQWDKLMYAADKKAAIEVHGRLSDDSLIGRQNIYIRQFVPLHTYFIGFGGLPITKEFRYFIFRGQILSGGFYWSSHIEDIEKVPSIDEVPSSFLDEAIRRVKDKIDAFALDVAQTADGNWIVVELNCSTMSGLSENDPNVFYKNLKSALDKYY